MAKASEPVSKVDRRKIRQVKKAKAAPVQQVQLAATSVVANRPATTAAATGKTNSKKQQDVKKKAGKKVAPDAAAAAAADDDDKEEGDAPAPDMVGDVSFRRTMTNKRQTNMQKLLLIGSRSISGRDRHLLQDLGGLLAHGRPHPKLDVRQDVGTALQELCDMHRCNGAAFLEGRKGGTSYLWLAQAPEGPSIKFQLYNVHTADELRMVGNCLKYSRPLLHFDAEFDSVPHLRIARALLTNTFNTPRYHARSKPFVDHVVCFFVLAGKIYFRHYQIIEQANGSFALTEIGPRFVMDPQVLLQGCVRGAVVWRSDTAVAPSEVRRTRKERALEKVKYNERLQMQGERHRTALPGPAPDPLDGVFQRS